MLNIIFSNPETDKQNKLSFQLQVSDTEKMSEEFTSVVNKIFQQYFMATIARFSKEVYHKKLIINEK